MHLPILLSPLVPASALIVILSISKKKKKKNRIQTVKYTLMVGIIPVKIKGLADSLRSPLSHSQTTPYEILSPAQGQLVLWC